MRRIPFIALGLAALTMVGDAYARCNTESGNSMAINACAEEAFNTADKILNTAYKQVMTLLGDPKKNIKDVAEIRKNLIEAQRAWVTFRDKDCTAVERADGYNTIHAGYHYCMEEHSKIRSRQLLQLLQQLQEVSDR